MNEADLLKYFARRWVPWLEAQEDDVVKAGAQSTLVQEFIKRWRSNEHEPSVGELTVPVHLRFGNSFSTILEHFLVSEECETRSARTMKLAIETAVQNYEVFPLQQRAKDSTWMRDVFALRRYPSSGDSQKTQTLNLILTCTEDLTRLAPARVESVYELFSEFYQIATDATIQEVFEIENGGTYFARIAAGTVPSNINQRNIFRWAVEEGIGSESQLRLYSFWNALFSELCVLNDGMDDLWKKPSLSIPRLRKDFFEHSARGFQRKLDRSFYRLATLLADEIGDQPSRVTDFLTELNQVVDLGDESIEGISLDYSTVMRRLVAPPASEAMSDLFEFDLNGILGPTSNFNAVLESLEEKERVA